MTHIVTSACFACKYTDCVTVCPVDAFREGEKMLYIDPQVCIDCTQCVAICPVGAIFSEDDIPEEEKEFITLNAEMSESCPVIVEKKPPLV